MLDQTERAALSVAIRCDATRSGGVGHLVRQVALIEELVGRGHAVRVHGDVEVPWARQQLATRGLVSEPVADEQTFVADCVRRGVNVVMVDGYTVDAALGPALSAAGIPVATMVDGEFGRHQKADLHIDQNLGACAPPDLSGRWLVGPAYVLLRDVVRSRRGLPPADNRPPRVLVVFGGTDAYRGAPLLTELVLSTGEPVQVVAVAASDDLAAELAAAAPGRGQTLEVVGPQDDLPGLALTCDAAISAAGSTVWELACIGVPTGLVCVADNQLLGYRAATEELCLPLGHLGALRADEAARVRTREWLRAMIVDRAARLARADRARGIVDGDGRVRVADALEELVHR